MTVAKGLFARCGFCGGNDHSTTEHYRQLVGLRSNNRTEYKRAVKAGLTRRVDATPFREWLDSPRCRCIAHVAEFAGISSRTLHRIKSGHQRTVKQSTADRFCVYLGWHLEMVA